MLYDGIDGRPALGEQVDVQKRYWQEFIDTKRDAFYISAYHAKTQTIDRALSGFTAIMSSTAVAGWVLWRDSILIFGVAVEFRLVWTVLIMASQIISATKEYFPYKIRLKSLYSLSSDLESLTISMEGDWYKISRGLLMDEEINDLHMDVKRQKLAATKRNFPSTSLPVDARLLERADADTQLYVQTFFGKE